MVMLNVLYFLRLLLLLYSVGQLFYKNSLLNYCKDRKQVIITCMKWSLHFNILLK